MYSRFFILFLFILHLSAYSQNECNISISQRAQKFFNHGIQNFKYKNYDFAEPYFLEAITIEPDYVDAYYALAQIYYNKPEEYKFSQNQQYEYERYKNMYLKYLKKVVEICPYFYDYQALFQIAKFYLTEKKYEQALPFVEELLRAPKIDTIRLKIIKKWYKDSKTYFYIKNNPVPFEPQPVEGISTSANEYLPILSPDGELFFYTRRFMKHDKNAPPHLKDREIEEFTYSDAIPDNPVFNTGQNNFTIGKAMPSPFNMNKGDQGGVTVTIDNKHLYVTLCNKTSIKGEIYTNCDIFSSDYVDGKWSPLKNLGQNINNPDTWESQPSVTSDGNTIYFASNRDGGYGLIDIWKSIKDKTGNWSKPINLGPVINTEGNEKSPFIHTDSQTLYFSSDGHIGLGGYDIFYSKMKDNGEWTEPVNIGYPINTEADDLGFFVSTDGKTGYFASNKLQGKGGWDIYGFPLYKEARPEKVLFLKGQVTDEKGSPITDAKVELKNLNTNKVTQAMVDSVTGKYAVAVAINKKQSTLTQMSDVHQEKTNDTNSTFNIQHSGLNIDTIKSSVDISNSQLATRNSQLPTDEYIIKVKKQGYAYISNLIDPKDTKFETPVKVNFEVKPIKVGTTHRLNDINFAFNSAELDETLVKILDDFIEFLKENPNIKIAIYGHTDNIGNHESNLLLSEQRANAVYDYLILNDIDPQRLSYKGFGESRPIASNKTEEGRAKNRRTEFVIVGK